MRGSIPLVADRYVLTARVFPAVVTLLPIWWHLPSVLQRISDFATGALAAIAFAAIIYVMATVARSAGKAAEGRLQAGWGGRPTTILLRHADSSIDGVTKSRYHRALSQLLGRRLPTPAEELLDPRAADEVYGSTTKVLIERTRGAQHNILQSENASYGFRRNLYGLRPAAIGLGAVLFVVDVLGWGKAREEAATLPAAVADLTVGEPHLVAAALDLGYVAFFVFVVSQGFVFQAAREYAEALFRTLDQ